MSIFLWVSVIIYTLYMSSTINERIANQEYGSVFVTIGLWLFTTAYFTISHFYDKWKSDK